MLTRRERNRRRRSSRSLIKQGQRRRPRLEALEDRRLLAAAPTITIDDVQQAEDSGAFIFTVALVPAKSINHRRSIGLRQATPPPRASIIQQPQAL